MHTTEDIKRIARGWVVTRQSIIDARDRAAEAHIFATNHGTHQEFLNALTAAASELGHVFQGFTPEEIQAVGELSTSWNSTLTSGRRESIKVISR